MQAKFMAIEALNCDCVQHLKSVDDGIARTEASFKMAIADSIFNDIVGDTAEAFLEAHGLQAPPGTASLP